MKLVILLFCVVSVNLISIEVKSKEKDCITRFYSEKDKIKGSYVVSGIDEVNQRVQIINESDRILWNLPAKTSGSFNLRVHNTGEYTLCFLNDGNEKLVFSFDFEHQKEQKELLLGRSLSRHYGRPQFLCISAEKAL